MHSLVSLFVVLFGLACLVSGDTTRCYTTQVSKKASSHHTSYGTVHTCTSVKTSTKTTPLRRRLTPGTTTTTSTATTTSTDTTTTTVTVSTSTTALGVFTPVQSTLPQASYNAAAGPVKRRDVSVHNRAELFRNEKRDGSHVRGYPGDVQCWVYGPCTTKTVTTTKRVTAPTSTKTTTVATTTTIVTTPGVSTTVTNTATTTTTAVVTSTDTATTTVITSTSTIPIDAATACAVNNYANYVGATQRVNDQGFGPNFGTVLASGPGAASLSACCLAALNNPTAATFFYSSGYCAILTANTCTAGQGSSGPFFAITTSDTSQTIRAVGNALCGSVGSSQSIDDPDPTD